MNVATSPVVTFNLCNDSITTTNAKPFKLKGGIPLDGTYSGAGVTNGIFYPAIAGVGTHQINYTYTNAALCSVTDHRSLITISPAPFICGNPVTDIRDNKTYPTVHIGSQCWMAANLNYGTMIPGNTSQRDNCIPEKYCYNDLTANCRLPTINGTSLCNTMRPFPTRDFVHRDGTSRRKQIGISCLQTISTMLLQEVLLSIQDSQDLMPFFQGQDTSIKHGISRDLRHSFGHRLHMGLIKPGLME